MNTTQTIAPAVQIGTCVSCKTVYRVEAIGCIVLTDLGGETPGYCGCRKAQGYTDTAVNYGKPVEVIYAPEVTCGGRCYTAKSSTCKCSCKGEGHGLAHNHGKG